MRAIAYPYIPFLTVMAAAGIVEIVARLRFRSGRGVLAYGLTLLAMAAFFFTNPPFDREDFRRAGEGEGNGILGRHYASIAKRGSAEERRALPVL